MSSSILRKFCTFAAGLAALTSTVSAHVSYTNRNFGAFSGAETRKVEIANQTFTSSNGWADATDADYGDAHHGRHFRFTLHSPASVTIKVEAIDTGTGVLKPGFTLYSGTAHLPPAQSDYDTSPIMQAYLATLGDPQPKEGMLRTLADWYGGGDDAVQPYDFATMLSHSVYLGNKADGSATNYGSAAGIDGDGTLDGIVEKTFVLPAGEYSFFVGGAMYDMADTVVYGAKVSVSVAPDPTGGVETISPMPMEGVPYKWKVMLGAETSTDLVAHVGAWSWEDNSLFDPTEGETPVGWTHTAAWAGITLMEPSSLTVSMQRQANVAWASGSGGVASTDFMFPSFTIWQNWDEDGTQEHTFDNRTNVSWAEKLVLVGFVDNSTQTASQRTFNLPAGKYTIVFGSNAPSTTSNRQGFKATLSTAPMIQQVALKDGNVPGLTGVKFKAFGSPTMNDEEQIAFVATLSGDGVSKTNDTAILSDTGTAQLALAVREGDVDPTTGGTFTYVGDPVTDNGGNVLFLGKLKLGRTADPEAPIVAGKDSGLWRYVAASGDLQLVAREGEVATGVEDGAAYKSFSSIVADSSGGTFVAKLVIKGRVTAANDEGVWGFTAEGFTTLLARKGKPFTVAPGDTRIVKTLHVLQSVPVVKAAGRSTNAAGGRVLSLTFKDGTAGIFHIAP